MRVDDLFYWISERHSIWTKRSQGLPKPWTQDKILGRYRFCNAYREFDTVTLWIAKNWRNPHAKDADLWFHMVQARLVNWPDTLSNIGYQPDWNPNGFISCIHAAQNEGRKAYSGAYIVSTNGNKMDKAVYLADRVLSPLWLHRADIRPRQNDKLSSFANRLGKHIGMGTFLTGQVIADAKYAKGSHLAEAADWWTWAAPGPGSKRGLNRVMDRPVDASWGKEWLPMLETLHQHINARLLDHLMPPMHAQDLQNCLCEFDKYERTRLGEGTPRSTYPGGI